MAFKSLSGYGQGCGRTSAVKQKYLRPAFSETGGSRRASLPTPRFKTCGEISIFVSLIPSRFSIKMATASDARDIFGLGGPLAAAPKKKKNKVVEPQPRVSGVKREIQALMGDSVPPIAIVEQKQYKAKAPLNRLFKTRHWGMRDFQHAVRNDGLVLKHWKRAIPAATRAPITTPTDIEMTDGEKGATSVEMRYEPEFPSDKWNVKVDVPTYTDEQYENEFKSEDWTREETDYLLELCRDFDLRWVLIADRYDTQAIGDFPRRTMEAMKLRYYTIAAKMMEANTPASNMTAAEFQLWENMRNFDAKTESLRKSMVEKLFERTKDEADEERILLEELHRITKNEEDFIKLRLDLYSRLESAPAIRRTERGEEQSTAMYQTSTGLTALLQTLLAKERKMKRPLPNGEQPQHTPVDRRGQPNQYSRRDTLESQDGPQKKGSTSQPNVRALTAVEEVKYGVSHPQERLTSGIQFRHQKIDRLTMAKSQVQTTKIQAALTELGIPQRLLMPTERVCREFERLVESVHRLIDTRKQNEKTTSEIKVLEEMKRIRLGQPKPEEASQDIVEVETSQMTEPKSDLNESMVVDQDADGEDDDDAEGEKDDTADQSAMQLDEQEDDDAEGEEDDVGDKSAVAEDEDEDAEQSFADLGKDDDEEEEEEEDEEQDDEDQGVVQDSDEEEDDGVEAAPDQESDAEEEANESAAESEEEDGEEADDDEEAEAEVEEEPSELEPSRPSSSHSAAARARKRSASVISDASKEGSNRGGLGRKKRR